MAELTTIARPYAEAAFRIARDDERAAGVVGDAALPSDVARRAAVGGGARQSEAHRGGQGSARRCRSRGERPRRERPQLRPRCWSKPIASACCRRSATLFEALKNDTDGVSKARIDTAFPLTDAQAADLKAALEKRFGRKIEATGQRRPGAGRRRADHRRRHRDRRHHRSPAGGDGQLSCEPEHELNLKPSRAGRRRPARREDTMQLNPSEISELIKSKIQNLDTGATVRTQGTVVSISDGIARVHGLSDAMAGEMLEFPQQHVRPRAQPRARLRRRGDSRRLRAHLGRRHGQVHGPHPVGAGRPRADRPRGELARASRSTARARSTPRSRTSSRRSRRA